MEKLCNQLAQRSVLYSAHERRWNHMLRLNQTTNDDLRGELERSRGTCQYAQERCAELDKERVALVIKGKELADEDGRLRSELYELKEKLADLQGEVADVTSENLSLQSVVANLRSSDATMAERRFVEDSDRMRGEFRAYETAAKRQLDELRGRLEEEVSRSQALAYSLGALEEEVQDYRRRGGPLLLPDKTEFPLVDHEDTLVDDVRMRPSDLGESAFESHDQEKVLQVKHLNSHIIQYCFNHSLQVPLPLADAVSLDASTPHSLTECLALLDSVIAFLVDWNTSGELVSSRGIARLSYYLKAALIDQADSLTVLVTCLRCIRMALDKTHEGGEEEDEVTDGFLTGREDSYDDRSRAPSDHVNAALLAAELQRVQDELAQSKLNGKFIFYFSSP